MVTRALKYLLEYQGLGVTQTKMDEVDHQEKLVQQGREVYQEVQNKEVSKERQILLERMEWLEKNFKVFLEGLAQWEHLVIRDQLVIRVLKDLLEYQGHQELGVTQAKMDDQAEVDHQDKVGQQGREVYQEVQDQEVSKECQVPLERMEWLEKMEKPVCKDHQE